MLRRKFLKDSTLLAFGISACGQISWRNGQFVGDSPTTTDILGPFYRPGAPFRTNLNPPGFSGKILHLSGTVYKDGRTRLPNCLLEIWQCEQDGLYDNLSNEYRYRAAQKTSARGDYQFTTTIPIPYPTDPKTPQVMRPAHIHMRVAAAGQQDLITQIYLQGDPYLAEDPSTKSPLAAARILPVEKRGENEYHIQFDLLLQKEYLPAASVFNSVSGVYKMSDGSMMEFYRNNDLLFYKTNGQIWGGLGYAGNNTFTGGVNDTEARFELLAGGQVKLHFQFIRRRKLLLEGEKLFNYPSPTASA
ncbi:MAG TPA: hypothetical protein VL307_06300 [Chitinophagaceae bacterium]|nr:hypothetical protein [Chitinophagaceae bacterium]